MYDVEKCSTVLENAAGFARLNAYAYSLVTKWRHWGMFLCTLGKQTLRSPEHCTSQNAISTEFLEVQIPPQVLVYDWDL